MDERKKNLADLGVKTREARLSLEVLLEDFGGILLRRADASSFGEKKTAGDDLVRFRELTREAEVSRDAAEAAGKDDLRLRELEKTIRAKEQEVVSAGKRLSALHRELGKQVLEDPRFAGQTVSFRERFDSLSAGVEELSRRMDGEGESSGVIALIGKNARVIVDRTVLSRKQKALETLHEEAGVFWMSEDGKTSPPQAVEAAAGARSALRALDAEIEGLWEERRQIRELRGGDADLKRRLRLLLVRAKTAEAELGRFCGGFAGRVTEGRKKRFADLFEAEDEPALERIQAARKAIGDLETKTAKLRASLAIDAEKAAVNKMKREIENRLKRIAGEKNAVGELEGRVEASERHIAELEKI
ncbi:MAG: hypothetical protein LBI86_12165 [Treponema sp.]|jgi:hypothetical protein|nr:hypothetical protein [Treponema sp.]